jgi:hypothetical protein
MSDLHRDTIPRGQTLPIDCAYRFSFGKPTADPADLPPEFALEWIKADDPRVEDAGFKVAQVYIVDDGDRAHGTFDPNAGGAVVSYLYLIDPKGEIVATWDEGRWWTPEESAAFLLMIRVPDTYIVAEGIAKSGLNRQMRRRKR